MVMKRIALILLLLLSTLKAEPFVLVTNPKSPIDSLSKSQVRMIYLKQRRYWKSIKLVPINLPPESELRKHFEKSLLKMHHSQLENYWIRQHYKGLRPPYRVESVESVKMFVKKVEGAIGYIPLSKLDKDLKVLYEEGKE